jgi:hypothetical protein
VALTAFALATAVLAGCSTTLTPRQQEQLDGGRRQIGELLEGFAAALRLDEPEGIRPLLPPYLGTREVWRREREVRMAGWLPTYTGYSLMTERAVAGIDWGDLQREKLCLEVEGTNARGEELEEEFELEKTSEGWRIAGFSVQLPQDGDHINPLPADREALLPVVRRVVEKLRKGEAASVYYEELPETPVARWRVPKLTWWERLTTSDVPERWRIVQDLLITKELHFGHWPDPAEELDYLYVPPNGITAVYAVDYTWPGGHEPKELQIKLHFFPGEDGWQLSHLRLVGDAIPWSEL